MKTPASCKVICFSHSGCCLIVTKEASEQCPPDTTLNIHLPGVYEKDLSGRIVYRRDGSDDAERMIGVSFLALSAAKRNEALHKIVSPHYHLELPRTKRQGKTTRGLFMRFICVGIALALFGAMATLIVSLVMNEGLVGNFAAVSDDGSGNYEDVQTTYAEDGSPQVSRPQSGTKGALIEAAKGLSREDREALKEEAIRIKNSLSESDKKTIRSAVKNF